MPRAPRKYTDPERTTITPAWLSWKAEQTAAKDEATMERLALMGVDASRYFPEDYGKDLGEGAWILVIDPPQCVGHAFDVPLLSLWWARPHRLNSSKVVGRSPYQAVIATPAGDLHLWPHEYSVSTDPKTLIFSEGTELHALGGDPVLDAEQLWYLQSRGISHAEAVRLLFEQIRQPNYIYATFPPEVVDALAGIGTRMGSDVAARRSRLRQDAS